MAISAETRYPDPTTQFARMALGFPVKFQGTPGEIRHPAPLLGQHSEEILREICNFDMNEVSSLLTQKVVFGGAQNG